MATDETVLAPLLVLSEQVRTLATQVVTAREMVAQGLRERRETYEGTIADLQAQVHHLEMENEELQCDKEELQREKTELEDRMIDQADVDAAWDAFEAFVRYLEGDLLPGHWHDRPLEFRERLAAVLAHTPCWRDR